MQSNRNRSKLHRTPVLHIRKLPYLVLSSCAAVGDSALANVQYCTLCHGTFAELTWLSQAALQPFLSRLYCAQRSAVSSDLFALQDGSYSASTMALSREL